jgi:hypothetical protein
VLLFVLAVLELELLLPQAPSKTTTAAAAIAVVVLLIERLLAV